MATRASIWIAKVVAVLPVKANRVSGDLIVLMRSVLPVADESPTHNPRSNRQLDARVNDRWREGQDVNHGFAFLAIVVCEQPVQFTVYKKSRRVHRTCKFSQKSLTPPDRIPQFGVNYHRSLGRSQYHIY